MPEYRPCIVRETIKKKVPRENKNCSGILWKFDIKDEIVEHKALFHQWVKRISPHYETDYRGMGDWVSQKYIGNDEFLMAIVEYEDGTIHECLLSQIQFIDGKAEKFSKNKKDDWNKLTDDTDSYPEPYENVLFKTNDGRIYYGCCDTECEWEIELGNEHIHRIKDVKQWRRV